MAGLTIVELGIWGITASNLRCADHLPERILLNMEESLSRRPSGREGNQKTSVLRLDGLGRGIRKLPSFLEKLKSCIHFLNQQCCFFFFFSCWSGVYGKLALGSPGSSFGLSGWWHKAPNVEAVVYGGIK